MIQNLSLAIFLINKHARAIKASYEAEDDAHCDTFKTLDQTIKVGDYVNVETDSRHNMSVFKVREVDIQPDLQSSKQMKWIVGCIDRANFQTIKRQAADAISAIQDAQREKQRRELADAMLANVEAVKKLPIYDKNGDAEAERPNEDPEGDPEG